MTKVNRLGNIEADTADFGRRHHPEAVTDIRRAVVNVGDIWYAIMMQLHRFMIAISWVSGNHDGRSGTAPDPLVWDQGVRLSSVRLRLRSL